MMDDGHGSIISDGTIADDDAKVKYDLTHGRYH